MTTNHAYIISPQIGWNQSYIGSHTHSLNYNNIPTHVHVDYNNPASPNYYLNTKEPELTTLQKIKQQRQEERERGRIERMYAEYDESGLSGVDDGTVATFTYAPDEDHSYRYAAIMNDEKWWVTGHCSPNGVSYEDFIAWLIEKDVEAADLTWWNA